MTVTLVDTGVLYAAIDRSDAYHSVSARLLSTLPGRLLVPTTVLVETSWHVEKNLGGKAEAAFLASLAQGELELTELLPDDLHRASELVETYVELRLGLVDASVVALAERLGVHQVATVDRRHFTVIRPCHVAALTLLPATL
ncbi:type II toxin-antitoxin system toxin ribonuclease C26 [Microbispora corallina]|uniref:Ribonuclease VapC n=1 Tax=Microbispora corallina TaxID=83302 RepID=A0ABQ4G8M6_9ACTN|nr:PIN domain-containing protein [Microbispora corallina]GIH43412.1 ribonuclease VapC [Microbispora corallina]